ncbi:alpha-amylase MalA [Haloquadratum walsbyi]|uniref:Glycosidase n=1 Tax=Haloquadratum walsbyi J07HQW2 TaxID=1238425 RepID=U1PLZ0_9EURY|nr:alpha-amylase MalA [Haloquadratum walsbyi]ERG94727.1 MAG: glycosidase [Haloquadratum walsbyi J07HQW2]
MQHPGPPRFMAVGESLQLSPRDPDPEVSYQWHVKRAPASSTIELPSENAVIEFTPDTPGTFQIGLETPANNHSLTVRVFPGSLAPVTAAEGVSGSGAVSGRQSGSARPVTKSGGVSGSGSGIRDDTVNRGRPRIQLHGDIEGDELVIKADPQTQPDDETAHSDIDVEFIVDDRDDISSDVISTTDREMRIPVEAVGQRVRVHAVGVTDAYSVPDSVEFIRDLQSDGGEVVIETKTNAADSDSNSNDDTDINGGSNDQRQSNTVENHPERTDVNHSFNIRHPNKPPKWATDVTLYEIYIRGFVDDDGEDVDSTFTALTERLDYLAELGVDCLWLTPVLQNDHAPHGYNITDFFHIASDLGDSEAYKSFVDAAHEQGMTVLFDLVLNHSARDHPFYQDAVGNPDSPYHDWYAWRSEGEPETYFEWEYIANWNFQNLEVRRHLLDVVDEWMEVADGFRCDMAWAVPNSFWRELRDRVKTRDEDFLLLDETIPYIADFHGGMFDMHFDTTLYSTLREIGRGDADAIEILDAIDQRETVGFPPHAAFMLYAENHDETRYIVECGEDAAMAVAGALFTLPGVPMLYGGQEMGQRGRRDALAWDDAREEIYTHYQRLIKLRNNISALGVDGSINPVNYTIMNDTEPSVDAERVVAYERRMDEESYICVLNFGEKPAVITIAETSIIAHNGDAKSDESVSVSVNAQNLVTDTSVRTAEGLNIDTVGVFAVTTESSEN